jgi:3-methyladenine DNA glycosylase/8-oxoguanine DNA glycosylase
VAADGAIWRAVQTPAGAGTIRTAVCGGAVEFAAWGPGADWLLDTAPASLGAQDRPEGFAPRHPVLRTLAARFPGWRVPRTGRVLDVLVPAVLEQKVTGTEARRAWRRLLQRFGEPAPGPVPTGMRVPPPAAVWRRVPSWEWHRAGVDATRSRTILECARRAARLEETVPRAPEEAVRRLTAVPGVGPWTAAEVRQRAHGDPDAVSVGDCHLPGLVGWALGRGPVDDAGMLELLSPYAGHRYRAVRLIELSGMRAPAFGPRQAPRDFRAI